MGLNWGKPPQQITVDFDNVGQASIVREPDTTPPCDHTDARCVYVLKPQVEVKPAGEVDLYELFSQLNADHRALAKLVLAMPETTYYQRGYGDCCCFCDAVDTYEDDDAIQHEDDCVFKVAKDAARKVVGDG